VHILVFQQVNLPVKIIRIDFFGVKIPMHLSEMEELLIWHGIPGRN